MGNKKINKETKLPCRKCYSFLYKRKKRLLFFIFYRLNRRKTNIYLCLILETDLPFKSNKEKWKCLILRDMDKELSLRERERLTGERGKKGSKLHIIVNLFLYYYFFDEKNFNQN